MLTQLDTEVVSPIWWFLEVPCQSYLSCVPDFISSCCSDANLEKFAVLCASFERSAFSPEYDPWTYVDEFGRSKIYKGLLATYRAVTAIPSVRSVRIEKDTSMIVPDDSAIKVLSKKQRKRAGSNSNSTTRRLPGNLFRDLLMTNVHICIYVYSELVNFVDSILMLYSLFYFVSFDCLIP